MVSKTQSSSRQFFWHLVDKDKHSKCERVIEANGNLITPPMLSNAKEAIAKFDEDTKDKLTAAMKISISMSTNPLHHLIECIELGAKLKAIVMDNFDRIDAIRPISKHLQVKMTFNGLMYIISWAKPYYFAGNDWRYRLQGRCKFVSNDDGDGHSACQND